MSTKIQYGTYSISNKVGAIVGYATENDFSISEIGNDETREMDGSTVMEVYSNHGLQASGTVALTDAQIGVDMRGKVITITRAGESRLYVVDAWDVSLDEDTGGAVASVTAHSHDSMLTEYAIGPRDPETGTPLSATMKFVVTFNTYNGGDMEDLDGITLGAFASSADLPTFNAGSLTADSLVDMSKAIATAKIYEAQVVFVVPSGTSEIYIGGNTGGGVIAFDNPTDSLANFATCELSQFTIADESSSSTSASV